MANDIQESIFRAIDTITSKRLNDLEYDKTIKCTIANNSNAAKGEYTVTDGVTTFLAYSTDTTYSNNQKVYVNIPNGDMKNQKIIVGKYIESDENNKYYTYVSPTQDFLDITGNIVDDNIEGSILANGSTKEVLLWSYTPESPIVNYSLLGLRCDFMSWLKPLNVYSGTYGIRIDIIDKTENTSANISIDNYYSLYLDTDDMYGNPYNFENYYTQEKLFDISMMDQITNINIILYQNDDFLSENDQLISSIDEEGNELLNNIFMRNLYISFGFDVNDYDKDGILLGSLDSLEYQIKTNTNKNIYAKWVHLADDKKYIIDKLDEMPENAKIHWYRFNLAEGIMDPLAGVFWNEVNSNISKEEINNYNKNIIYYNLIISQAENEKARLETLKQKELDAIEDNPDSSSPEYQEAYNAIIEKYDKLFLELKTNLIELYNEEVNNLVNETEFLQQLDEFDKLYGTEDNNYYLEKHSNGNYYFNTTLPDPDIVQISEISRKDTLININNNHDKSLTDINDNYTTAYELAEAAKTSELRVLEERQQQELDSIIVNGYTKENAANAIDNANSGLRNSYENFLLKLYRLQPPTKEIENEIFERYKESQEYLQEINSHINEENYKYPDDSYSVEREKILDEYFKEYNDNNNIYENNKEQQINDLISLDSNVYDIVKQLDNSATNLEIVSDTEQKYYNLIEQEYNPIVEEEDGATYITLINRDNVIINSLNTELNESEPLPDFIDIIYHNEQENKDVNERINISNKYLNEIKDENTVEEQYLIDYNYIKNNADLVKTNFYREGIYENANYIEEYDETILVQDNEIILLQNNIENNNSQLNTLQTNLNNENNNLSILLEESVGNTPLNNNLVIENEKTYYLTDEQYSSYTVIKNNISNYTNDINNLNITIEQENQQLNQLIAKRDNDLNTLNNKYYNLLLEETLNEAILTNKYNRFLNETYEELAQHQEILNNIQNNNNEASLQIKQDVLNDLSELQIQYQSIISYYNAERNSNLERYNTKVNNLSDLDSYTNYYNETTQIYHNSYLAEKEVYNKDNIPIEEDFTLKEREVNDKYNALEESVNNKYLTQKQNLLEQKNNNIEKENAKYEKDILNLKYSIENAKQIEINELEEHVYYSENEKQEKINNIKLDIQNSWNVQSEELNQKKKQELLELSTGEQIQIINDKYNPEIEKQENIIYENTILIDNIKKDYLIKISSVQSFNQDFILNPELQNEKFKVIIEYPSKESVQQSLISNEELLKIREEIKENTYCVNVLDEMIYLNVEEREKIIEDLVKYFLINKKDRSKGIKVEYEDKIYYLTNDEYSEYSNLIENLDFYKEKLAAASKIISSELSVISYIESNILEFNNEDLVANSASVELVKGLQIECDVSGYNGIYRIYDENDQIMSKSESSKKRLLTAKYNSIVTGDSKLDQAEKIIWKIPLYNTMIYRPTKGVEYGYVEDTQLIEEPYEENGFLVITRMGVFNEESAAGAEEADSTQQYFRIKENYSQAAVNNTVYCQIIRNKRIYEAEYELHFGPSGTNGTDYTFTLEFDNKQAALTFEKGATLIINPYLFDYENNDITDKYRSKIKYRWYSAADPAWENIKRISPNEYYKNYGESSQARINLDNMHIIRYSNAENMKVQCLLSTYEEKEYYNNNNGEFEAILNPIISLENNNGNAVLTINDISGLGIDDCNYYILQGYIDDIVTIGELEVGLTAYLPIPIRKEDTYYQFDGPNKICYDSNGTTPTYYKETAQIYKLEKNKLMPIENIDWHMSFGSDTHYDPEHSYAYYPQITSQGVLTPPSMYMVDNGVQISIVGMLEDDIIWIQPLRIYQNQYSSALLNSWDGNLTIDEKNGTILSTMVGAGKKDSQNRFNGVLMGDIESTANAGVKEVGLYGFNQGEQSFGFKIDGTAFIGKSGRGRINFDGNRGIIQSGNYSEKERTGMQIDLDGINSEGSSLKAYGPGGSFVLDTSTYGKNLLDIKDGNNKTLLHMEKDGGYYIQSSGYKQLGSAIGSKFDLANAKLDMYGSGGSIIINGESENALFRINGINSNNVETILMNISNNDYYIQSKDYSKLSRGIKLDLNKNRLISNGNGGTLELNTDNENSLFKITSSNNTDLINISGKYGYLIQSNNKNVKLDLSNNKFIVSGNGGTVSVNGDSNASLFQIKANNETETILLNAAKGSYYLQSVNFSGEKGIRIDLNSGRINAYDFNIKAYQSENPSRYISINSQSSTYPLNIAGNFYVDWGGKLTANIVDVKGNISGSTITGSIIKGSTISGNNISGGTISGSTISGNNISGGTISGTTIRGSTISGGTISGGEIQGGFLRIGDLWASNGSLQVGDWGINGSHITHLWGGLTDISSNKISTGKVVIQGLTLDYNTIRKLKNFLDNHVDSSGNLKK